MSLNKKLLWGGLGWVFGGPIGAILGYTYASMSNNNPQKLSGASNSTKHGDFVISVLVLFAKVMKADGKLLKSELDYMDCQHRMDMFIQKKLESYKQWLTI